MVQVECGGQLFEPIQAVLFDKDGTLAQVEDYLRRVGELRWRFLCEAEPRLDTAEGFAFLRGAFGFDDEGVDPAGLLALGSRHENAVVAAAGLSALGWGWITATRLAAIAFGKAEQQLAPKVERTPLLEASVDLIERLQRANVKVGIVSADLHSEVSAFVDFYALSQVNWFCGARGDSHQEKLRQCLPKTHPDFLPFACAQIDVAPERTLVIGDSASDLLVASRGAAGFVAMTGGWQKPVEIDRDIGRGLAIATVSHLSQVEVFA